MLQLFECFVSFCTHINVRQMSDPDENYARENLQLHSIGLVKLNDDGTAVLDRFGSKIVNYEPKNIFTIAKIWTGLTASYRRGMFE